MLDRQQTTDDDRTVHPRLDVSAQSKTSQFNSVMQLPKCIKCIEHYTKISGGGRVIVGKM